MMGHSLQAAQTKAAGFWQLVQSIAIEVVDVELKGFDVQEM